MNYKALLFAYILLAGCTKNNDLKSSEKVITSVLFEKALNPSIPQDISGNITSDSINFDFPDHVAINNLIPTINFKGQNIVPSNKTAQNFTIAITYTITAEDGSTKNYVFSVNKISSDTATLIQGYWKLIMDSVTNINNYNTPGGTYPIPGVYHGTDLDYWQFHSNGLFTARENNISGSDTYHVLPDSKLDIPIWTIRYGLANIETITSNRLTVYYADTTVWGGRYYRKVYLKR